MRFNKHRGLLLLVLSVSSVSANASPESQEEFKTALAQIDIGNLSSAALLLELIALDEPTQRVLLELAKVQFLQGEMSQAKENFLSVKDIGALPLNVRDKVDWYLQQIDKSEGYARYQVGVVNDDNPLNFTSVTSVRVGSFDFEVTPPSENEKIVGLEHSFSYSPGKIGKQEYFPSAILTLSDFKKSYHDKMLFYGNLDRPVNSDVLSLASIHFSEKRNKSERQYSVLGSRFLFRATPYLLNGQVQLSYSHTNVKRHNYLNSNQFQLDFRFPYSDDAVQGWYSFGYLAQNARERPYSSKGPVFRFTTSGRLLERKLGYHADFFAKESRYELTDPIFGFNRHDELYQLNFVLEPEFAQVFGAQAQLGFRLEKNVSSIQYYGYEKVSWMLSFR
jgi:hypothetical protein